MILLLFNSNTNTSTNTSTNTNNQLQAWIAWETEQAWNQRAQCPDRGELVHTTQLINSVKMVCVLVLRLQKVGGWGGESGV